MNVRLRNALIVLLPISCLFCVAASALSYRQICPDPETIQTHIPRDADLNISLERTQCFGDCPVYVVSIQNDGTIFYHGRQYVRYEGMYSAKMTSQDFERLIGAFEEYNYFALVAEYRRGTNPICGPNAFVRGTDAPSVTTLITVDGRQTGVAHYHGQLNAPDELRELEDFIDDVAQTDRWVIGR